MKLYHYVHCPFCIRVRLALGLLNLNYESVVLPYDDKETPLSLTGKKMLPIFSWSKGDVNNESLDIIKRLDSDNALSMELVHGAKMIELNKLLTKIGASVHSLCMPYWIWTPEFNEQSRSYFIEQKQVKRGPFNKLIQNKEDFILPLNELLEKLEDDLSPFYKGHKLTILDISLASHLWGMYIFPEFQFSKKVHDYLQSVGKLCAFNYHEDFWAGT